MPSTRHAALLAATLGAARALDNGLARTPPMGWNTWCTDGTCGHDVCTEAEIKSTAAAMHSNGLLKAGYEYINLDDCWANPTRDGHGAMYADPARFPSGIASLTAWLHERGFKFGLYIDAGTQTCSTGMRNVSSVAGSLGHYEQDARTFAAWGVDYIKMDWCSTQEYCAGREHCNAELIGKMSAAINGSGRAMLYQCPCVGDWLWPQTMEMKGPYAYCAKECNTYRVFDDHHDTYSDPSWGARCSIERFANLANYSRPGAWSDADFLMTGGGGCADGKGGAHCAGQSDEEYRTEMAMWAIMGHPLIVATDVRNLTRLQGEVLLNTELIAINQQTTPGGNRVAFDASCPDEPHTCGLNHDVHPKRTCQVFARQLEGGDVAIALYNAGSKPQAITADFSDLPGRAAATWKLRDLWQHKELGAFHQRYAATVPAHGTRVLRASRADFL